MSRRVSILFLGGAKRVSMARALIDAGKKEHLDVEIFSHELSPHEPIASVASIIVGSRYDSPGIIDELGEIIQRHKIDIVLPFIDPSIELATKCADIFGVFSPTSPAELTYKLFDKVEAAALFERHHLPVPTTYSGTDNIKFPAILKPRCGSASKGIIVAHDTSDLQHINHIESYLVQQYIAGAEEYTLDCYVGMLDGEIKCIVPRKRIATVGGEVSKTQTVYNEELTALGRSVLESLGLRGTITLQFLYDKQSERYLLMEINPRLGGGVICSLYAGADIPSMIIKEAMGSTAPTCLNWRDKTLMTRYQQEVVFYE